MRNIIFSLKAYLVYWLKKEDQYSQQSPFVFKFYSDLINFLEENKSGNSEIETFRKTLLADHSVIEVLDLGAGSRKIPNSKRKVSAITRHSTSGIKFAQLYQFFCKLTPAEIVIELGTCVGISTRYLRNSTSGKLYTLEGSPEIQRVAQIQPQPSNTHYILGPIDETLPLILAQVTKVDFALIDANHTYEGTIFAFNSLVNKANPLSIFAIGDIHWTSEMERAWSEIKSNPKVKLTLDFFECGIVFFDYSGGKSNLVLDI